MQWIERTHADGSRFLASPSFHECYAKWLATSRCWHGRPVAR